MLQTVQNCIMLPGIAPTEAESPDIVLFCRGQLFRCKVYKTKRGGLGADGGIPKQISLPAMMLQFLLI